MSNDEKVARLQQLLKPIIDWYKQAEADSDIDSSYLYDMTVERFDDLGRGDFQEIVEILK